MKEYKTEIEERVIFPKPKELLQRIAQIANDKAHPLRLAASVACGLYFYDECPEVLYNFFAKTN